MARLERPPIKRVRDDRKDIRRNQASLLRKKLLKKAINTSMRYQNVPPVRRARPAATEKATSVPAVRKTKTATEAASGAQKGWRKLYVGDLYDNTTSGDLRREFGKFGKIFDIWIARNPPGFAFVDFFESRDAARALRVMDGNHKLGKKIKVEFAKTIGPRTASALSAVKKRQGRASGATRGGRQRKFSGSRGDVMHDRRSPPRREMSPQQWHRSQVGRIRTPPRRRSPLRFDRRRSPSPLMRRGNYPPPPPLPPLPPLFDPYDPQFREMTLMGGWNRGRSPLMAPPPPPPPRYRSRSPSPPPRYRGRTPPPSRRSPGRFAGRDRNRGRTREDSKYAAAAASLVYPPLSLPPPSLVDMNNSPPRRLRSPPRRRTPPRLPAHSRSLPQVRSHSPGGRGRIPSPNGRPTHRSPMKPRSPPPRHRSPPPRHYSPQPRMIKSPPRRRASSPGNNYHSGHMSPPHPNWNSPHRNPPPLMRQRLPHQRSRSRSPLHMRSPPRPRSPPPEHSPRGWSPPPRRSGTPPRGYTPPQMKPKSPDRPRSRVMSNHSKQVSPPPWGRTSHDLHNPVHNRTSLTRQRTPPRGYTPPPRNRSPPRYKMVASSGRPSPTQSRGSQNYSSRNSRR